MGAFDDFLSEYGLSGATLPLTKPEPKFVDEGPFDCQKCGACCIESGMVVVDDEALAKLDKEMITSHPSHGHIPILKRYIGGRCKQLQGVIGKDCKCGIYENRPSVCAMFKPGSEACLQARSTMRYRMKNNEFRPRGYGENWESTVLDV